MTKPKKNLNGVKAMQASPRGVTTRGRLMRKKVGKEIKKQILNNEPVNKSQAMRNAGYSKSVVNSQVKRVVSSKEVQEEIQPFLAQLDEVVENSLKDIKIKQLNASFRDNIHAVDTFTKLNRLIQGKSTENKAINISEVLNNLEKSPKEGKSTEAI